MLNQGLHNRRGMLDQGSNTRGGMLNQGLHNRRGMLDQGSHTRGLDVACLTKDHIA